MTKYTRDYLRVSQTGFGEGAISPGGLQELREIFSGLDIQGQEILDIGSGLGGFTAMLVESFGAKRVRHPTSIAEISGVGNARIRRAINAWDNWVPRG